MSLSSCLITPVSRAQCVTKMRIQVKSCFLASFFSAKCMMQNFISLLPLISSIHCFMASPLDATKGLLQDDGHFQSLSLFEEYDVVDFSAYPLEVVIPIISEAFDKYDTFGTMEDSSWHTRIGLDFLMNEAQWNFDSNDQFKTRDCGIVMKGL